MNPTLLVRRLIIASVVLTVILSAYAISFTAVFKLGRGSGLVSAALVCVRTLLISAFNIGAYVFCNRYWHNSSERARKWRQYAITVVLSLIVFPLIDPVIFQLTRRGQGHWDLFRELPSILWQTSINYCMVVVVHQITILHYERAKTMIENAELKAARLESAYQVLRQQTHPHFLFNALSMLKSLYKRDVPAGEAYLAHLVNFLRASLTDNQAKVSPVADEIGLCWDYITMQKIRFADALRCDIQIPEAVLQTGAIPSFSLQSLLENAIKHNEITAYAPLCIRVYYQDGWLVTENNIQPKSYIDDPTKKGLANLMERYRLISDERVQIKQENGLFSVSIKVLSYENRNHRG